MVYCSSMNLIVAFSSYFIIGADRAVDNNYYTISSNESDGVYEIEGLNPKKAITIISDSLNEIAEKVTTLMGRGYRVL